MHPPFRARRILKLIGIAACVSLLLAWAASLWCKTVILLWGDAQIVADQGGVLFEPYAFPLLSTERIQITPHSLGDLGFRAPVLHFYYESFPAARVTFAPFAILPFWLLLLLTAIPTAWLWHRDRRLISSSPDHRLCLRCGYDLNGNTSGVCPECGEKTAMANSK